jgi:hypothetical protein
MEQQDRLTVATGVPFRVRKCEHSFRVVDAIRKWQDTVGEVLCRKQCSSAATGCCGFNAMKQCLGISDIKQVMTDTKHQILKEMNNTRCDGVPCPEMRDLRRINSALLQVDNSIIDGSGWFTDFLAVYIAKSYGISILIIRPSGNFTFIQVIFFAFCHYY